MLDPHVRFGAGAPVEVAVDAQQAEAVGNDVVAVPVLSAGGSEYHRWVKITDPRLVRDDRPIERAESLTLPAELAALVTQVHGVGAVDSFEIPADYGDFVRTHGGGLWTLNEDGAPDAYGRKVYRFSWALTATAGLYEKTLERLADEDIPEWEGPAAVAAMREAGVWLEIGGVGWRHLHFLCCDRSRTEFGQVYDVNDGDPSTGLAPDRVWGSFREYIA
ncbi:hypothetical protein AB0883_22840 [Micromonospora sp. NPDC047812]|uniref:hypothetical protein n=1 Tax=Micromonospora sp. NPDC047812 TaxID=3155742 RepID=UPI003455DAD3